MSAARSWPPTRHQPDCMSPRELAYPCRLKSNGLMGRARGRIHRVAQVHSRCRRSRVRVRPDDEPARLLEAAVLDAFTTERPCRRKANRSPGTAALAEAARLRGHNPAGVVVDLEDY